MGERVGFIIVNKKAFNVKSISTNVNSPLEITDFTLSIFSLQPSFKSIAFIFPPIH